YHEAMKQFKGGQDKAELFQFYQDFAQTLMYGGYHEAWRLQALTDLAQLPDYEESYYYGYQQNRGEPVRGDGTPVFHKLPKSYAEAASDGERWRWLLMQAAEMSPEGSGAIQYQFADFLRHQFDVQTM